MLLECNSKILAQSNVPPKLNEYITSSENGYFPRAVHSLLSCTHLFAHWVSKHVCSFPPKYHFCYHWSQGRGWDQQRKEEKSNDRTAFREDKYIQVLSHFLLFPLEHQPVVMFAEFINMWDFRINPPNQPLTLVIFSKYCQNKMAFISLFSCLFYFLDCEGRYSG